jgi:hypothetical protein
MPRRFAVPKLLCFVLFVSAVALGQDFRFNRYDFATGIDPGGIAVADFNGDGLLDAAVTDGTEGTVTILLGQADGTFKQHGKAISESSAGAIVAADFNNDGKVDLVVADWIGSSVTVYLGNGNGTFKKGITSKVNYYASGIAVGDFNNDGNLDIAAVDYPNVSVLLGQGNGKFSAPVNTAISATQLYTADMNNDGKLDLVVAGSTNSQPTIAIWLGNGSGGFTNSSTTTVKGGVQFLAIADFNLDGNLDVAASAQPWYMLLLTGDGKGGVSSQTNFLSASTIGGIFAADFDGNKAPDVVQFAHPLHPVLVAFLNNEK